MDVCAYMLEAVEAVGLVSAPLCLAYALLCLTCLLEAVGLVRPPLSLADVLGAVGLVSDGFVSDGDGCV